MQNPLISYSQYPRIIQISNYHVTKTMPTSSSFEQKLLQALKYEV